MRTDPRTESFLRSLENFLASETADAFDLEKGASTLKHRTRDLRLLVFSDQAATVKRPENLYLSEAWMRRIGKKARPILEELQARSVETFFAEEAQGGFEKSQNAKGSDVELGPTEEKRCYEVPSPSLKVLAAAAIGVLLVAVVIFTLSGEGPEGPRVPSVASAEQYEAEQYEAEDPTATNTALEALTLAGPLPGPRDAGLVKRVSVAPGQQSFWSRGFRNAQVTRVETDRGVFFVEGYASFFIEESARIESASGEALLGPGSWEDLCQRGTCYRLTRPAP